MNKLLKKREQINLFSANSDLQGEIIAENHRIIYIVKGTARFTFDYSDSGEAGTGKLLFLPLGSHINYRIKKNTRLLVFRLADDIQAGQCHNAEDLLEKASSRLSKNPPKEVPTVLQASAVIKSYVDGLIFNIGKGLEDEQYYDLKIKELLCVLKFFYKKEELAAFFSDTVYTGTAFPAYISRNHHRFNTVGELAESMNYTASGFEKRFKKHFGMPPAKWMREQKAKRIYRDVCLGEYNFKEIADRYNFASTSTFNDFFKLSFGETPGNIRKKATLREK